MFVAEFGSSSLLEAIIKEFGMSQKRSLKLNKKSVDDKTVFDLIKSKDPSYPSKHLMQLLTQLPEFSKIKSQVSIVLMNDREHSGKYCKSYSSEVKQSEL